MEKQANNSPNKAVLKSFIKFICTVFLFTISFTSNAQVEGGEKYIIKEITVTGNTNFSAQTIIAYSKLRKDEEIQIGGEKIANAVKTLWKSNLFSSIDIYVTNIDGNTANLEINLIDLPELIDVTIEGVKKGKKDEIINENDLKSGKWTSSCDYDNCDRRFFLGGGWGSNVTRQPNHQQRENKGRSSNSFILPAATSQQIRCFKHFCKSSVIN